MSLMNSLRRVSLALLTGCAVAFTSLSASIVTGAPAHAQPAQSSEDMQAALEAYGSFRAHPRFGQVWVPAGVGREWRPYENGHWVYTDDWGWYWVSDQAEEDWGWVTYHYGRWAFERRIGWFWVPGDEWAPAWVDWRYGDDYIGWAPLPPDDQIDAYDTQPAPWVFVPGRYMTAPRLRSYIVTADRRAFALRSTRLVNRTVAVQGRRMAVNPGISPAFVAAVTRTALPSYRVRPRVFGSTQGVSGAVQVKGTDLRGARPGGANGRARINAVSVQRTTTLIQPAATSAKPEALSKGAGGQLGTHPPRAAQSGGSPPQEQQQQTPPKAPAPVAPKTTAPVTPPPPPPDAPQRSGPAPGLAPVTGPAVSPPPPRSGPPPTSAPPALPPPAGNAPAQQGEQVKPVRPVTPQTPPPPPPPQLAPRQPSPPPPVAQPAPPSHPVAPPPPPPPPPVVKQAPPPPPPPPPAVKQAPPPPPPAPAKQAPPLPKPGEKPAEVPK